MIDRAVSQDQLAKADMDLKIDNSQLFLRLRSRHPRITYSGYACAYSSSHIKLSFQYRLGAGPDLETELSIPLAAGRAPPDLDALRPCIARLGMVELLSYWKAACPPEISVEAYRLEDGEAAFWEKLLRFGLGEFFFRNGISPGQSDLVHFTSLGAELDSGVRRIGPCDGALLMVAGGKDSSLMQDILSADEIGPCTPFSLNPSVATVAGASSSGSCALVAAERRLDPALIELNKQGYLNGHTPFSALLAFIGTIGAAIHGRSAVVVANESSAGEPSTWQDGVPINHQYSKSYEFESDFRNFAERYLRLPIEYFSFLRPLLDLQVSALFARLSGRHAAFLSCNVGQRENRWCAACPKCAFVYLTMRPFLSAEQTRRIFGSELCNSEQILGHIAGLCGIEGIKPFECVGTTRECRLALKLLAAKLHDEGNSLPAGLGRLAAAVDIADLAAEKRHLLGCFGEKHFLPAAYERLLRRRVEELLVDA